VVNKDPWYTVDLMLHVYVYHVIETFILQMPFLADIQERSSARDVIYNRQSLDAWKKVYLSVRIAIGLLIVLTPIHHHIRSKLSIVTQAALQL
jgi:hypothetical protein